MVRIPAGIQPSERPMTSAVAADSIVNLCGAIGLGVAMFALHQRDPGSPLTKRLLAALGTAASLFALRSAAWTTGSETLDLLSLVPAALVPFGALIVTEGMLRRHAPRLVKLAAILGAAVLGLGGALGLGRFATPYSISLSLFLLAGFAACAWLLMTRDRNSLLASENRSIDRTTIGALVLIPFIMTDFQSLIPGIPVRLGALGTLLIVTAVLIASGGAETRRQGILLVALRLSSAALLGIATAYVSADVDAAQIMRFCAIAVAGVLTIGLMTDTLRAFLESREPGILNSVAASPARTRDQLIAELVLHPIFESARRYREVELADYDPPLLRDVLGRRRVLRRSEAPWGLASDHPCAERMLSLMTANSATHIIIVSHDPVDMIVLAVPVVSADPATETAIALVRRLLATAPETA
jgi:hypothetical protein